MKIGNDKTKLHPHFFIFPFKCDKCGNKFMLEYGLRQQIEDSDIFDNLFDDRYRHYCGICSVDIMKEQRQIEE